jgi:catechol 2,3-dioxygenase-like lactoylglutathione lyase family enzyme
MHLVGLDHIALAMPAGEEEKARTFYSGLLGLTEIPKPEALQARGGCWFDGEQLQIHLGVEDPFIPAKKAHPGILVSDLEAFRSSLTEAGIEVKPDPATPEAARFHFSDPFGNRLEFLQNGEGFSQ